MGTGTGDPVELMYPGEPRRRSRATVFAEESDGDPAMIFSNLLYIFFAQLISFLFGLLGKAA